MNNPSLEQRVAELEARVAQLEGRAAPVATPAVVTTAAPAPARAAHKRAPWDMLVETGEGWLGRAGVGLLVVGLILLFRYAVDRGWLTPEMRIAIGMVIGSGLMAAGAFYFVERRRYRQILAGGGIVILFITGLAAVELYQLVSGTVALAFFVATAGAAFLIAANQKESIIASIGAVGALVPPSFLLADTVPGTALWLYLAIIMAWTGVLLVMRRWERALLVAAATSVASMFHRVPDVGSTQAAAVTALVVCWLCFAALPLLRLRVLPKPSDSPLSSELVLALPVLLTLGLAFVADYFVFRGQSAFELTTAFAGIGFAIVASSLQPLSASMTVSRPLSFRSELYRVDSYTAAVTASAAVLAVAVAAAFDRPWMFVAVTAIATAALYLRERVGAELLRPFAHAVFAVIAVTFATSIERLSDGPAFDTRAIAFAIVCALAAVAAFSFRRSDERATYLIGVFVAAHVLLSTELVAVRSAPWLASASYAVIGSTLLISGLALRRLALQRAGMVSLALLVARLFLYDLAQLDVGVRIVLFLVCGFGFLGLSYVVRSRRFVA